MCKNNKLFLFVLLLCFSLNAQNKTVKEVVFLGAEKLKKSFLERVVSVEDNQELDSLTIQADIRFLTRLPAIANAAYKVIESTPNSYTVQYILEENFTIIPSFNVYTSNNEELAYRVGVSEYNFLGRNITIGGFYQKDVYDSYRLSFQVPYLFSNKLGLSFSYQDFTSLEPVFFSGGTVQYKYNNVSYEVLGMYEFDGKNRMRAGVNIFTEDYKYQPEEGDITPPVLDLIEDKILYKIIYQYDNLSSSCQYVSGFQSVFNFQYVTSETNISSPNFLIGWNDFMFYNRLGSRGNFASRLRVGLATNNDSPFAPFALDNNVNIRGVGNVIDRGTGSIVLNTEYRHSFIDSGVFSLQGNVFVDSGSWRNPGGDFNDFIEEENIVVFSGLGLRFIHKKIVNAIFRIDYGVGLTEDTHGLVFGIGQYF